MEIHISLFIVHPCLTCVEMRVDFSFKSDWNLLRRTAQIITKPTVSDYWVLFATDMRRVVFELLGLDNALLQQLRDLLYCVVPCIRLLLVIVGLILCCCEPVETLCYLPALRHRMLATYLHLVDRVCNSPTSFTTLTPSVVRTALFSF